MGTCGRTYVSAKESRRGRKGIGFRMRKMKTGLTKKILACVLSTAMLFAVSCGKEDNAAQGGAAAGDSAQGSGDENTQGGTDADQSAGANGGASDHVSGNGIDGTVTIDTIYQAVKEAYGEDYLPAMLLSEDEIQVMYGIEPEWCEEILVEVPMMSVHVDTFLAVKAKPEHLADISDAVNAYVENLKSDTMQYPANLLKIQASSVVTMGDYVFYVMLGYLPAEMEEEAEDVQIAAYEERNQVAIDVIESLLLK